MPLIGRMQAFLPTPLTAGEALFPGRFGERTSIPEGP